MEKFLNNIYPFTTEHISLYMEGMDVKGKSVLTVGSSCDQAFNAIFYGANDVTIIDVNRSTKAFCAFKTQVLLASKDRKEFYTNVLATKDFKYDESEVHGFNSMSRMSDYMRDEASFKLLQTKMKTSQIDFIPGNVFNMDDILSNIKYDRIILSNVMQYFASHEKDKDAIKLDFLQMAKTLINHLNDKGLMQLAYVYGGLKRINEQLSLYDVIDVLYKYRIFSYSSDEVKDYALVLKK